MIEFDSYKQKQGVPIYLQLADYIKSYAASGAAEDGEELPSRRWLSARLGINPNTVQKVFSMLELEGIIVSKGGSGSAFTLSEEKIRALREEMLKKDLGKAVAAMKNAGLSLEDAVNVMKEYWEEEI